MKKTVYLAIVAVLVGCLVGVVRAQKLEIGAKFPVDKLSQEKKPADNTIIAFMPSLTFDCEYASMLTQSFYYYFDQQLAFDTLKKHPTTRIFLVVRDTQDAAKSTQNIFGGMRVIYDEKGELFSSFGVKQPARKNADSTIVLLDSSDTITYFDEAYRAQGEHLKPVENKLKELNGIYNKVNTLPAQKKSLKLGDKAPDFRVNERQMLSDLRGSVVLISFYPAAFSGTLPKPAQSDGSLKLGLMSLSKQDLMACSVQIKSLDLTLKSKAEVRRIAVSSSTTPLLNKWREVLGTEHIEYTNDADYSISSGYFSYNPKGYNNRVSVIIDQEGKIAYIDEDFDFNDEKMLNGKIDELLNKENK